MKDANWQKCVLCADSNDVIKRIPDNSIDFILTDPPYNLGLHSTGNIPLPGRSAMNNDVADWDMVDFNPEDWVDEFVRILKSTGNLFIFTSYNQLGRWYNCLDHKFDTSNFMVWHKTNPAPKIFKAGFLNSCEMIYTCWNKKHTWNFLSQKEMHNFIESPICMRPERLNNPKHPAQKPVAILKKMIEIATNKNDIVFDPFMGVGLTGVAAIEKERRFIGVELNNEYFEAAKKRIDMTLDKGCKSNSTDYSIEEKPCMVHEPLVGMQTSLFALDGFFKANASTKQSVFIDRNTNLSPIIKWPGGKEKELRHIIPNLPHFDRFFEPFVGGGSVFMGINAKEYLVNDFSEELIQLYRYISETDKKFFGYAEAMDASWNKARKFFRDNKDLVDVYLGFRNRQVDRESLKKYIANFCLSKREDIEGILDVTFRNVQCTLCTEVEKNLFRKMVRMHELEMQKHELPLKDLNDNIETAIKSALYMNFRNLYNDKSNGTDNLPMHCALFFFMRNYAYSGMFRYSSKGEFNVPYGGIAYNSKLLKKKLDYYKSKDLLDHFNATRIFNLDFEEFLKTTLPTKDDFVFLDPPYDSEFCTYAQKDFTKEDQKRLANYMINECPAKWMMIIKYTDFIYGLYNKEGINIRTFDKEYLVSFMNRNDKRVTHLLITNY